MILAFITGAVGIVVGAFSHKWLAAEFQATTGVSAQSVADQAKAAVKTPAPKA